MATTLARRATRPRTGMSAIFSADPFDTMRDEFDQILSNWFSTTEARGLYPSFAPALDMKETDSAYEVEVDLPGIKASDVNIQMSDNVLSITGERKIEKEEGKTNGGMPHYVERYHGAFTRSIALPSAVKPDKIDAQYHDGVLTIMLPKADSVKPCQIAIKT